MKNVTMNALALNSVSWFEKNAKWGLKKLRRKEVGREEGV
jgi:hypothetical protein